MDQYLPIFCLAVLATLFAVLSLLVSRLFTIHRPTDAKIAPYECGIVPTQEPAERFPVRFYLVAMIFIIFDIEIVFLYPWAVIFRQLRLFGLLEMLVFAIAVLVALVYLVANGALDWGPGKRLSTPTRTTESTIRRLSDPSRTGEAA
jgi:NADH-quinone oxidoreductase subunit A